MSEASVSPWISVSTPERVELELRLAGPGSRLGAYGIDLTLRALLFYAFALALSSRTSPSTGWSMGALFLVLFVLEWGYGAAFETWWRGQTPGKRALGLRVVRTDGAPVRLRDAWLRNLLRAADFIPLLYGAGLIASISTKRMQRIGDLVADTMVIREPHREALEEGVPRDSAATALSSTALGVSNRRTVALVDELRRRSRSLSPSRTDEIARSLATSLADRQPESSIRKLADVEPSAFLFRMFGAPSTSPPMTRDGY